MKHFRKVWTDELDSWLKTTKGMKNDEAYALFLKTFPDITDVTRTAFCNQRSRIGAAGMCHNPHFTRKPRPLYSEHTKKGYVQIKVAQPSVWMSKAKWVYQETHPWEDLSELSEYIFLDGNIRNFHPNNIARLERKYAGIFSQLGSVVKGQPELTKLRIIQAKMKYATFDLGETAGLVEKLKDGQRRFIDERNAKARARNSTPERRKILAQRAKIRRDRMKAEDPERYRLSAEAHKAYAKEYYRKRRNGNALQNN